MKIHIVKKGESLYLIAQKYNVSQDEILKLNPSITNPDVIDVGMKLKIPSGMTGTGGMDIMHQHVVKQGDTLWKLSKAWGIPLADMIKANPQLKNPNVLLTGEIVNIPKHGAAASAGQGGVTGAAVPNAMNAANAGASNANANAAPIGGKANTAPIGAKPNTAVQQQSNQPSLLQGVQGLVGKLSTAPIIGKAFGSQAKANTAPVQKAPTAPIVKPVAPEAVPAPPPVKVEQKAEEKPLPLAKPIEKKGQQIHAEHNASVDLFKQYGIPATEATSFYDMPKVPESNVSVNQQFVAGSASGGGYGMWSQQSEMYPGYAAQPYCPPGTVFVGSEQVHIYEPYKVESHAGLVGANANANALANANAAMLANTNANPLANATMMPSANAQATANAKAQATANANANAAAHANANAMAAKKTNILPEQKSAGKKAVLPAAEQPSGSYFGLSSVSPLATQGYGQGMVSPESMGPVYGYGQGMVSPESMGPMYGYGQGMVSPESMGPMHGYGQGMVSPESMGPMHGYGQGMVSPESMGPMYGGYGHGMVSPESMGPMYGYGQGMVSPESMGPMYGYGQGMVSPAAVDPCFGYGGNVAPASMQPSYGYGYPTANLSAIQPYGTGGWPQTAGVSGKSAKDDCGCGGKRDDEQGGERFANSDAEDDNFVSERVVKVKSKKKPKVRTVAARGAGSNVKRGSKPWINR